MARELYTQGHLFFFFFIKTKKEKIKGDRKPSGLFESMNLFYLFFLFFESCSQGKKKNLNKK